MTTCIVGWAHTPFGRLENETVESLIVRVATGALADAGVAPADVDEIVLGHFNAGFSAQDFSASLVLQASPDLRFKRATRVENACATGVSMHVLCAMQLTGTAGDFQVRNPLLAGLFNMGGAAVANYVSILERIR